MDGEDPRASLDGAAVMSGRLVVIGEAADARAAAAGLQLISSPRCEALIVSKSSAGVDAETARALRELVLGAAAGRFDRPKYLVIDFAHDARETARSCDITELARELADLVLRAPVVPVACVRAPLSGPDVELALSCSLVIAQRSASFDFDVDPLQSLGLYALVAQKIGFVRTERLMEQGLKPSADEMKDLLLVHDLVEDEGGLEPLESLLERRLRRHNSFHSIYRAQRMVARPADRLRPAS